MNIDPIDGPWAEQKFPAVFRVFGAPLRRQINAFNEILTERGATDIVDLDMVFARMVTEFAEPHRPLLNTLSLYRDDRCPPGLKGMLKLLDSYLTESLNAGDPLSTYRSMLRSSGSYIDLIAELDWACRLRASGGKFNPHAATDPQDPLDGGDYDVCWEVAGQTLHGDVKWFKDWLMKPRGEDLLSGQIKLIQTNVRHNVVVLARMRHWTVDAVIEAADEALTLYHAAVAGIHDPRWALGRSRGRIDLRLRAASDLRPPEHLLIEGVSVYLEPEFAPGKGHIQVIETSAGREDDREAVRRNLAKAATQIPTMVPPDDVCCAFIGSAVDTDREDVGSVLYSDLPQGNPKRTPGLLDPDSPVPGYEHLHGVVHFSLNFAQDARGTDVVVSRSAALFQGLTAMNDRQRAFLDRAMATVVQSTVVTP
jgi:hypothetical protein